MGLGFLGLFPWGVKLDVPRPSYGYFDPCHGQSVEGRCFVRFSRFWLMMDWNSCVWTLQILPENGDYEIIFGPFFRS